MIRNSHVHHCIRGNILTNWLACVYPCPSMYAWPNFMSNYISRCGLRCFCGSRPLDFIRYSSPLNDDIMDSEPCPISKFNAIMPFSGSLMHNRVRRSRNPVSALNVNCTN